MNWINILTKQAQEGSLTPSIMWGYSWKPPAMKQEVGPYQVCNLLGPWRGNLQPPVLQTINVCCLQANKFMVPFYSSLSQLRQLSLVFCRFSSDFSISEDICAFLLSNKVPSLVLLAQDLSQSAVKVSAWSVVSAEGSTGGDSSSKLTHMVASRSQEIQAHPFDHR